MIPRYTALIFAQLALVTLLPAQVQLVSDPSTPFILSYGPVADFNGDGIPDLATYDDGCPCLIISLGEGNGLFKPVSKLSGQFANYVFAGDLNQDGKLDIISVPFNDNVIGVSFRNGDGTFRPQIIQQLPLTVYTPALGDLNGDGIPDLVINAESSVLPIKPFVAMIYPTTLLPDVTSDYDIQLLGYFPDELGKPEFLFPDGKVVEASLGADNRPHLAIPVAMANAYQGKRIKVGLKYKDKKRFILSDEVTERDIWLTVLPSTVLAYNIKAEALPDTVFDHPQVIRDAGTPADAGEERNRDIPWGLDDLTTTFDFVNTYDKAASSIESTILVAAGGNNPTGDNSCSIPETAGQRVVLHEHAHGKPSKAFEGGKGADVYCKVAITLKLARQGKAVTWHFKNSAPESGTIRWGGDVELFPEPAKELTSALLDLTDFTFDPPQHRTLSLNQSYRSKFVQVNNSPTRISLVARTLPRVH